MTREELKREAKEYADKYGKSNFDLWDTARFAYYQGAEPREKRIAELEAQIEKMKSCTNCINNYFLATEEPCCSCTRCYARTTKKTTDKWEIKENDL